MKLVKENMDKSSKAVVLEIHSLENDLRQVQTDTNIMREQNQNLRDTLASTKERQIQLRQELE